MPRTRTCTPHGPGRIVRRLARAPGFLSIHDGPARIHRREVVAPHCVALFSDGGGTAIDPCAADVTELWMAAGRNGIHGRTCTCGRSRRASATPQSHPLSWRHVVWKPIADGARQKSSLTRTQRPTKLRTKPQNDKLGCRSVDCVDLTERCPTRRGRALYSNVHVFF